MNRVILMGRLTRDPEVRYSQGERSMAIARYTLAVDRRGRRAQDGNDQTADFINCVMWREQAERFCNWTRKGMLVAIVGRIQTRSYENQQGQRVYVTEVVAESFQVLEKRDNTANQNSMTEQMPPNFASPMDITDDKLPF